MEIKIKTMNDGTVFKFLCDSYDTRSGFAHKVKLYKDGILRSENVAHYLNRTWENFRYQTAMLGALEIAEDNYISKMKNKFKADHDISRMTAKYKDEFQAMLDNDMHYVNFENLKCACMNDSNFITEYYA